MIWLKFFEKSYIRRVEKCCYFLSSERLQS